MKYRVTEMGFIGRLVRPGEIIEWDGPPPIAGLVPIDEPAAEPAAEVKPARKPRAKAAPPVDDGEADVI